MKKRLRDDLRLNRDVHAAELDARYIELVEKSGLSLESRGYSSPLKCLITTLHTHTKNAGIPVLAFRKDADVLTLVTPYPLEEGSRLLLRCLQDPLKGRVLKGVIQQCRSGQRLDDDKSVNIAIFKISHRTL